jgi:hypothetical protein
VRPRAVGRQASGSEAWVCVQCVAIVPTTCTHHHHHTPSSRTKFMPARRHAACAHETHPFHPRSSVTDKRQSRVGLLMALIAPVAARTHMSPTCTARRAVHPAPPLPAFPRSSMPAIHRIAPRPPGKECAHSAARLRPSDRLLPHIAAHTSAHSPCTACLQPHKLPRRQPKSSPPALHWPQQCPRVAYWRPSCEGWSACSQ